MDPNTYFNLPVSIAQRLTSGHAQMKPMRSCRTGRGKSACLRRQSWTTLVPTPSRSAISATPTRLLGS